MDHTTTYAHNKGQLKFLSALVNCPEIESQNFQVVLIKLHIFIVYSIV